MQDKILAKLKEFILRGNEIAEKEYHENGIGPACISGPLYEAWMSEIESFSERNLKDHPLRSDIHTAFFHRRYGKKYYEAMMGYLRAIESEFEAGMEGDNTSMNYNNGIRFFISYSGFDQELAEDFKFLLVNGMGIASGSIFSTIAPNALTSGKPYVPDIGNHLIQSRIIFLLLSCSYFRSPFCLAELGAAWATEKTTYPLLVAPVTGEHFNKTPLIGKQYRNPFKLNDLTAIYDELVRNQIISSNTVDFNKYAESFVKKWTEPRIAKEIKPGWYQATIKKDRFKDIGGVKEIDGKGRRRCYQIDTLIPTQDEPKNGETHWLFYDANKSDSLRCGDIVQFHLAGKPDVLKDWHDGLINARNIYADSIEVINKPII